MNDRIQCALQFAAGSGNCAAILNLLHSGAEIHAINKSARTPLHEAAYWNLPDVAQYLISQGANINIKALLGYTPLHAAVDGGNPAIASLLIMNGSNVNPLYMERFTPLDLAAQKGNQELVEVLRQHAGVSGVVLRPQR